MENKQTTESSVKKRWLQFPDTYIMLIGLCLLALILTNVLSAGEFDREVVDGRTVVIAGTFHEVEGDHAIPLIQLPVEIHTGFVNGAQIVGFMLIMGGCMGIITKAGAINFFIQNSLARRVRGKEKIIIPLLMAIMAVGGFTFGMTVEGVAFVPAVVTLCVALGYDALVGMAIVFIGGNAGYTAGIFNPFNVGVAQSIAELDAFSGSWYRWVLLALLLVVSSALITRYATKVKSDPKNSVVYGTGNTESWHTELDLSAKASIREYLGLAVFVVGFAFLIWGASSQGWWFGEFTAVFFWIAVATGLIYGYSFNEWAKYFVEGMRDMVGGAVAVGFAQGISAILNDGVIMDTVVYYLSLPLQYLPRMVTASGMMIVQSILNLAIPSGSAQATVTMPIMVPLSDLLGVSRQTAVFAFQCGDGISNCLIPTYTSMITYLAAARLQYKEWFKFAWKIVGAELLVGLIMTIVAVVIGYA